MREGKRRRRWPFVLGGVAVAAGLGVALFQWDWLIPMVDQRATTILGRRVSIAHLHVKPGRVTHIVADGVVIDNPPDWPGGGAFASAEHLSFDVDVMAYLHGRGWVLPSVALDQPKVDAQQLQNGAANWDFGGGSTPYEIGELVIRDGQMHVRSEKLAADFQIGIATRAGAGGKDEIVASARGDYAKQPITAELVGGALLSLRSANEPYPIGLQLANGPTRVSLVGTIQNPLAFAGARLQLELAGPDLSLLLPLTGIAIPKTPAYRVAGHLDYANGIVKFVGFEGKVGSSDLAGDLQVDTKPERPVVSAALRSRLVDLKDLAGFIGAEPGDADKGTKRAARSSGRVLPDDPLDLPKLTVADVHLTYQATRIQGRRQPLDNMRADLDIVAGQVSLHPLSFGIGHGQIVAQVQLADRGDALHAKADVDFQRIDLDKLLAATGVARGAGAIGGRAVIEGTGRSLAEILAHGSGELRLYMGSGGNVSAMLVDLAGLQFADALLAALGLPARTRIQCFVSDFALKGGEATSRLTVLDTEEARLGLTGAIDLRNEALRLLIRSESKHFTVGSLPTPIGIRGTLGNPAIAPELGEAAARAATAVGLGILLSPIAGLLPTIQLGIGEDGACAGLLHEIKAPPQAKAGRRAGTPRRKR